jgi:hypothetical protein
VCAEEPFYREHEGKRFCVLHFPGKEKAADFEVALLRKVRSEDFDFHGVYFPGDFSLYQPIKSRADFSEATFAGRLDFGSTTFKDLALFVDTKFGGHASFNSATFDGAAYFTRAVFDDFANFGSTTFRNESTFLGAAFKRGGEFSLSRFNEHADFCNVSFVGLAYFHAAGFSKDASFNLADFSGQASFNEVSFGQAASFERSNFRSNADFFSSEFMGKAIFHVTTFEAYADFSNCGFCLAADFNHATFRQNAAFMDCDFSGRAVFGDANFGRDAYFTDATFASGAVFTDAIFRDRLKFAGSETQPIFKDTSALDLQFATVDEPEHISFHSLSLRPHCFANIDVRKFELAHVDWDWRSVKQEIKSLENRKTQLPFRALTITCRRLAANAEESQRFGVASKFRYMAMEARRLQHWNGFDFRYLSWWYWLASGYGERIPRASVVLFCIWFGFAVFYTHVGFARLETRLANETDVVAAKRDEVGAPLKFPRALTYSASVITFQKPEPKPATTAAQTVVLFETILGPVQAALLALAIRRKFMR